MTVVDQGKHVFLVLSYLSANFDMMDLENLLFFLKEHIGLSGSEFESYLQGCLQCISISNILSTLFHLVFGVPQGSVLRPIIFGVHTLFHMVLYYGLRRCCSISYSCRSMVPNCIVHLMLTPQLLLVLVLKPVSMATDHGKKSLNK